MKPRSFMPYIHSKTYFTGMAYVTLTKHSIIIIKPFQIIFHPDSGLCYRLPNITIITISISPYHNCEFTMNKHTSYTSI